MTESIENVKLPNGGTHEALQAADEHQQAARLYDGKLGLARLFLERNEPVTQPKAAHSTSRMPHPESVPEAV
ncbi:MAG: hypothetical protein ACLR0N_10880 [Bilophila wadsworthia]